MHQSVGQKKLKAKSRKGIFVGVYDDAAYRIYIPDSRESIKSKDVTFFEGSTVSETSTQDNQNNVINTPVNDHIYAPRHPPGPIVTPRRSVRVGRPTEKAKALAGESALHSQSQRVVDNIPIPRHINEAFNSPQIGRAHV